MKRVIVDCDPGIDDTFALIYLAAAHLAGEVEICAVTTTSGNVDAKQCAVNAAWVLEQCGVSTVPVAAGRAAPLEVALVTTPETHGGTGLGYVDAAHREVARNWEALWIDAMSRMDALTGPLTNVVWGLITPAALRFAAGATLIEFVFGEFIRRFRALRNAAVYIVLG